MPLRCTIRFRFSCLMHGLCGLLLIMASPLVSLADDAATDSQVSPSTQNETKLDLANTPIPEAFQKDVPQGLTDLLAMEEHIQKLVMQLRECTVGVQVGPAQGSGVLISEDGYILTAGHVIGAPQRRCSIILPDGSRVRGRTLGRNLTIDAGLIKIVDDRFQDTKWTHSEISDMKNLKPGDWCIALGHPGGYNPKREAVVRLGRVIFFNDRVLRSDCELVGGDSGGPLFDMHGRVIGINSRIQEDTNANYHVPSQSYLEDWDRLVDGEEFTWHSGAFLGVTGIPHEQGLKVTKVWPDEPADQAGIQVGDIIVTFGSRRVADLEQLTELVGRYQPKSRVELEIIRGEKTLKKVVRLVLRKD